MNVTLVSSTFGHSSCVQLECGGSMTSSMSHLRDRDSYDCSVADTNVFCSDVIHYLTVRALPLSERQIEEKANRTNGMRDLSYTAALLALRRYVSLGMSMSFRMGPWLMELGTTSWEAMRL